MSASEEKNPLEDSPFEYRRYKNGNVSVFFNSNEVTILKGKDAQKFTARIERASEQEAQMIMAKITGNFKRGNEREGKQTRKSF